MRRDGNSTRPGGEATVVALPDAFDGPMNPAGSDEFSAAAMSMSLAALRQRTHNGGGPPRAISRATTAAAVGKNQGRTAGIRTTAGRERLLPGTDCSQS
jgi:hypothetical protein